MQLDTLFGEQTPIHQFIVNLHLTHKHQELRTTTVQRLNKRLKLLRSVLNANVRNTSTFVRHPMRHQYHCYCLFSLFSLLERQPQN